MFDTNELVINMGPQHPSTHGVLRVILRLDGEKVVDVDVIIGYLHRGIEKLSENRNWTQIILLTDRMDYVAAATSNVGYCETVEKLRKAGKAGPRESGTVVRAWPDPKYFDTGKIARRDLEALLRAKAVLLPGLKVTLQEEGGKNKVEWLYTGGLSAYLQERLEGLDGYVSPIFTGESYCAEDDATFAQGEGAAWSIAWAAASRWTMAVGSSVLAARPRCAFRASTIGSLRFFCRRAV